VLNRIGPLDEEPDRSVAGQFIQGTPLIGVWDRQGQYSPLPLSPDLKRLAAGGENTEVGTGGEQMVRQAGTGIDQVLAIIEQEQEGARAECGHKGARDRLARHLADAQARRNHLRHEEGIGDRREIDHPDTIREGGTHLRDNLQGQPGLATAPHTGQGDQPLGTLQHEGTRLRHILLPPDQGCARCRQVMHGSAHCARAPLGPQASASFWQRVTSARGGAEDGPTCGAYSSNGIDSTIYSITA
jgi:hypothetical protein